MVAPVSVRRHVALVALLLVIPALSACATRRVARQTAPPSLVTVPELADMARNGTSPSTMYAEVQSSGTVYRLSPGEAERLRSAGVPSALISNLELTYEHAVRTNPSLATSDEQWRQVDGYWYGGTPFGWPREWVVGAPPLGAPLRRAE